MIYVAAIDAKVVEAKVLGALVIDTLVMDVHHEYIDQRSCIFHTTVKYRC